MYLKENLHSWIFPDELFKSGNQRLDTSGPISSHSEKRPAFYIQEFLELMLNLPTYRYLPS